MFINNGFSFLNIKGTYTTDGESIKPLYEYGLTPIYSPHNRYQERIFYEFASLNPDINEQIIEFCNKYGLLYHNKIKESDNNNYLFLNTSRSEFSAVVPADPTSIPLSTYRETIIFARTTLDLITALEEKDLSELVKCILFILFNDSTTRYILADSSLEIGYFRLIHPAKFKKEDYSFQRFIREEVNDCWAHMSNAQEADQGYFWDKRFKSYTYECVISISEYLIENCGLNGYDLNGCLILGKEFTPELLAPISERLNKLAASIVSDIFNWALRDVSPIMKYENNQFIGDWKISTLLESMYFELYISLSQDVLFKKCPCCGTYFELSKSNTRKRYCSDSCNDRMAQRRRREKLKNNEIKSGT